MVEKNKIEINKVEINKVPIVHTYSFEGGTIREEGISEVRPAILDGGIGEFYHTFGSGGAAIGLRIPIDKVNDKVKSEINSAIEDDSAIRIEEAKHADLYAKVIKTEEGYKYLEIGKQGYEAGDDWNVVEKLRNVATNISKEDYSNHIKDLPLQLKTFKIEKMVVTDKEGQPISYELFVFLGSSS